VDSADMELVQELILEGHEPRSISENSAELYTDIFSLGHTANHVLLACPPTARAQGDAEPQDAATLIVCFPSQYVLAKAASGSAQ
jgi:hypothetical protein